MKKMSVLCSLLSSFNNEGKSNQALFEVDFIKAGETKMSYQTKGRN
jgi:hypothetical protein